MKRRNFIITTSSVVAGLSLRCSPFNKDDIQSIKIGLITDLHYADRVPEEGNSRYYRESLDKLAECVEVMNEHKVDFFIQLGDFKDQDVQPDEKRTLEYLRDVEREFCKFNGPVFHVLGNHDHDSITKYQYLRLVKNWGFEQAQSYYSYDMKGFHFVVLDANYMNDGTPYNNGNFNWKDTYIPNNQLEWLEEDLHQNSKKPCVVFVHQRLDDIDADKSHFIKNANEVRAVFKNQNNVLLVLQGHDHRGAMNTIDEVFYYTLKAAVEGTGLENNNYAILNIDEQLQLNITGFRNTKSHTFSKTS